MEKLEKVYGQQWSGNFFRREREINDFPLFLTLSLRTQLLNINIKKRIQEESNLANITRTKFKFYYMIIYCI